MTRPSLRPIVTAIAVVAFAAMALIQPPGRAYACSCVPSQPVPAARDESAFVFTGTVSGIAVQNQGNPEGVLVTFDLIESWKGPSDAQLTLRTSGSSASCGYEFVAGERYLVYGVITDGQLSTNLCTRTAQLDAAAVDLAELGPGTPVGAQPAGQPAAQPASSDWLPIGVGVVSVLLIVAGASIALRARAARG